MDAISAVDKHSQSTYARIHARLDDLRELSTSNLALKRLIKRNMKREHVLTKNLGQIIGASQCSTNQQVKIPFVVAKYQPDPSSIPDGKKGRSMGLANQRNAMQLASKVPIRILDDQACLHYLDPEDSDTEEDLTECKRGNGSVSRNFYMKSSSRPTRSNETSQSLVDERLIDLLERMPMNKRFSMRQY